MKLRIALIVLAIIATFGLAGMVWAQDETETPSTDFPVYPGSEVTMEVNIGNADILPMLKAMLPMMSGNVGKALGKVGPENIAAALKDVTQMELLQIEVAKPGVKDTDIADFYAKKLPAGKWSRVFWQSGADKSGMMAVYAQSGMESIYGFRVETKTSDGKQIKRAQIAKIKGKIDFMKLMEIAGKLATNK